MAANVRSVRIEFFHLFVNINWRQNVLIYEICIWTESGAKGMKETYENFTCKSIRTVTKEEWKHRNYHETDQQFPSCDYPTFFFFYSRKIEKELTRQKEIIVERHDELLRKFIEIATRNDSFDYFNIYRGEKKKGKVNANSGKFLSSWINNQILKKTRKKKKLSFILILSLPFSR